MIFNVAATRVNRHAQPLDLPGSAAQMIGGIALARMSRRVPGTMASHGRRRLRSPILLFTAMLSAAPLGTAAAQSVEQAAGLEAPLNIRGKVAYFRIAVPDLGKAVDFYTRLIGMKKIDRANKEQGEADLGFDEEITQTNPAIGLILMEAKPKAAASGNAYADGERFARMVFAISDTAAVLQRAREKGYEVGQKNGKNHIVDASGNMAELIPLTDLPDRKTAFSETRLTFAKIIANKDPVDFYTRVLGMSEYARFVFKQRVREIGFSYYGPRNPSIPALGVLNETFLWDFAETFDEAERYIKPAFVINVANAEELAKKATSMGFRRAAGNPIMVMDPGGNIIQLVTAPKGVRPPDQPQ
jgi:catechol 2,3-dioxygenase-like lactoylglutathione lyase family enzyme